MWPHLAVPPCTHCSWYQYNRLSCHQLLQSHQLKYWAHTVPATPARVSTAATHSGSITGAWTAENFWRFWYHGICLLRANLVSSWGFQRRALIWSDMRLSCWQTSTQLYPDCAPLMVTGSGWKLPNEEYTYLISSWLALRLIYYQPLASSLYIIFKLSSFKGGSSVQVLIKIEIRTRRFGLEVLISPVQWFGWIHLEFNHNF